MKKYEKIPIPAQMRWREFRIRVVPVLLFFVAILVVALLWEKRVQSPDFVGKVTADRQVITAPADGILKELFIEDFMAVQQGEAVAVISRAMEGEYEARKERIKQEIALIEASLEPVQTAIRGYIDQQGLQFDLSEWRLSLASLRSDSVFIELEFQRRKELFERGFSDRQNLEEVEARRAANQVRIKEKRDILNEMRPGIEHLEGISPFTSDTFSESIQSAIRVQESQLQLIENLYGEIEIRAPFSGVVQATIMKRSGFVAQGDTIAVIESRHPEFIRGYVRQPFSVRPEPGMKVEIRSRGIGKNRYEAVINEVGAQIRPISPDMRRPGLNYESGLPVKVRVDEAYRDAFIPGEIVDMILL